MDATSVDFLVAHCALPASPYEILPQAVIIEWPGYPLHRIRSEEISVGRGCQYLGITLTGILDLDCCINNVLSCKHGKRVNSDKPICRQ